MLLFHEEGSSRGEYRDIAPRLVKMGYNCLAVDLRTGRGKNYISNETARRAASLRPSPTLVDCIKDIQGAVRYIRSRTRQPVVLLGSSFSASLCLLEAVNDTLVRAVVAFSPGEFFRPFLSVKDSLNRISVPVLLAGSKKEYPYLSELASGIPPDHLTLFVPSRYEGEHGTASLLSSNPASGDYWLSLLMFFRNLRNEK
jgi:dienelactone hydrolase